MNASERVIFLGASNLSRSFATAVSIARATLGTRLSIHAAMGPGRAFGVDSGFLGKKFPKIFSCGIWDSLGRETVGRTTAFVTDMGNDLAYEVPPDAVLEWVSTCVDRLQAHHAQVVITALPIEPLKRLSRVRFQVLRSLLYPKCRLKLVDFLDRVQELNEGLNKLAESQEMPIFTVPNAWYGFDPIHPRGRFMTHFWRDFFALSNLSHPTSSEEETSFPLVCYLRCLRSPGSRLVRRNTSEATMLVQLFDGTKITLY